MLVNLRNQFKIKNLPNNFCKTVNNVLKDYLMGIAISKTSGQVLYFIEIDPKIKINLFSQFLAALSMFGEENLGKINRINIEGLNVELALITKHDLIATYFFRPDMVEDYLYEEAEKCLDLFYSEFKDQIDNNRANQNIYEGFDEKMCYIIYEYMVRLNIIKKAE